VNHVEQLSTRKAAVLDILDEQIALLEKKLAKAQPLFDELNQLKRTRATLLTERSVTGGISKNTRITMEQVIQAMREHDEPISAVDLAKVLGVDDSVARSHLNRHKDLRYRQNGDKLWSLIGETDVAVEDEEDEE
jgi:response regulator of citrate/malate metabolism